MTRFRTRWTVRCVDLLLRSSYVIVEVDRGTSDVLLNITGAKAVRLEVRKVRQLLAVLNDALVTAERHGDR